MREKISACIMTYNEEANIHRCLSSVAWCDEIVVVDSFSTDRTVDICREFTQQVHQHEWLGYIGQRNLIREMASHPWVLFLDADEEISPELRVGIQHEFELRDSQYVGYEFPRLVHYLGRWIRHGAWYPDLKLRLFLKEHGYTGGVEPHDTVVLDGPVKRLPYPIWHYTYRDISDHINTMNRFSSISAQAMFESGRTFHWHDFLFRPAWRFFKGYFLRLGCMDGRRGLIIAIVNAFGVATKYAKLWELERTDLEADQQPLRWK
jgi:glycosyltransferase involved in cell wall biosynthesis